MINLVIKDHSGQSYELTARTRSPRTSSAKRYSSDSYSTFRFVARLPVTLQQWMQILNRTHHNANFHSSHPGEVYQAVAQCILRGDLAIYKLPTLAAAGALKGKNGFGLCIIKGPNPHIATDLIPEVINTTDAAQQLFNQLGISSQLFLAYLNSENLYNTNQKQNPLADALHLFATGELLAYKIPLPPKAPPAKAAEFLPATAADRPVPLAPDSNDTGQHVNAAEPLIGGMGTPKTIKTLTPEDIEIAKSVGSTPRHIEAREVVARDFLVKNGFTKDQIEDALGAPDGSKQGGVDLLQPVEVITFPPPEKMSQYVKSHGYPGNWFDPLSAQPPEMLGISGETRTLKNFTIVPGKGLKSIAKPVVDTWTNPTRPIPTSGGGVQLLVNDETKNMISSINLKGI